MANAQLQLITLDDAELWKLDAHTIRVGRKGLAQARAALARTRPTDEGTNPATRAAA